MKEDLTTVIGAMVLSAGMAVATFVAVAVFFDGFLIPLAPALIVFGGLLMGFNSGDDTTAPTAEDLEEER